MQLPLLLAGAGCAVVLLGMLLILWWRRYKVRRIAEWIAVATVKIATSPNAILEQLLRQNLARLLGLPVNLIRVSREKGGTCMRVVLCGAAVNEAARFHKTVGILSRSVRRYLPPWSEFQIVGDAADPGVPTKPPEKRT